MAIVPVGDQVTEARVRPVVDKLLPLNANYAGWQMKRAFWRVSYNGGDEYPLQQDGRGESLLWQHPREDPDTYAVRKKSAKCPNFTGPITRMFNDFVFRKKPERDKEGPPEYLDLIDNADGYGLSLDDFMRQWLQKGQVEQVCYCMPVNPIPDGMQISTKAEAQSAGARPRLLIVGSDQVVNWTIRGGQMIEALLLLEIDGKPTARYITETTRQDFKVKRAPIADRERGKSSYTVTSAGPVMKHGYPGLPLVPLIPMPDDLCADLPPQSQAAPVAEQQQDYLNVQSWLREELWNCVFTQYWVSGARPPSKTGTGGSDNDEVKIGSNRVMWFTNPAAKFNATSAVPEAAEQLRLQLTEIKMNVYLAAGLEAEDATKQKGDVQSGVALAFKFQNLAAQLKSLADACGRAENKIWILMEGGWGFKIPKPTHYPDEFDIPNYAEELAGLIQALATQGLPSVLREELVARFVHRNLSLAPDRQQELDDQMEARKDMVEGGLSAFPLQERIGGALPPKPKEPPTPGDKTKK